MKKKLPEWENNSNARKQAANRCLLPRVKKEATLTAFKTCPSRDGFAWRVKMPTRLILFPLFLI